VSDHRKALAPTFVFFTSPNAAVRGFESRCVPSFVRALFFALRYTETVEHMVAEVPYEITGSCGCTVQSAANTVVLPREFLTK
jgi:hypothetical protein